MCFQRTEYFLHNCPFAILKSIIIIIIIIKASWVRILVFKQDLSKALLNIRINIFYNTYNYRYWYFFLRLKHFDLISFQILTFLCNDYKNYSKPKYNSSKVNHSHLEIIIHPEWLLGVIKCSNKKTNLESSQNSIAKLP